MYMKGGMRGYASRGLRAGRRRGLGQTLNCPGDPGCPGNIQPDQNQMIATPLTPAQISNLSAGNAAFFSPPSGSGMTFTQWLNSNALTAILATGIFILGWKAFIAE